MLFCLLSLLLFQQPAPVEVPEVVEPPIEPQTELVMPAIEAADPAQEAAELLQAVAEAQFPSKKGVYVDGLNMKVQANQLGEHPRLVEFNVFYTTVGGEELELIIDDPDRGGRVAKGFSGRDYWLSEGDNKRLTLSGHEYTKDREAIDEAMQLCSDLLLLVDLRSLIRYDSPQGLSTLEDGTRIVFGAKQLSDGLLWDYRLAIPGDSLQPSWLEVQHVTAAKLDADGTEIEAPQVLYQRFEMIAYKRFAGRNVAQGIRVFNSRESTMPDQKILLERFTWSSH